LGYLSSRLVIDAYNVLGPAWVNALLEVLGFVVLVLVVAVAVLWRATFELRPRRARPATPIAPDELAGAPIEREPFDQDAPSAPQTRRVGGTARDRPGQTREDDPVL
jgi:hypothetical protein